MKLVDVPALIAINIRLFRRERHDEAGTTSEGLCLKILPFLGPVDKLFFWVALHAHGCVTDVPDRLLPVVSTGVR